MNRSHSVESYLRVIERVRAARPDIAVSGDFIVGFPGESEADFQATLDIVRSVDYAMAYSFKYSTLRTIRSEEHTSELQSLMRISYAVICWKKQKKNNVTLIQKK